MTKVTDVQIIERLRELGNDSKASDNALILKAIATALNNAALRSKPLVRIHLEVASDEIERALMESSAGLL